MAGDEAEAAPPFGLACALAWLAGAACALWRSELPGVAALWTGLLVGVIGWGWPNRGRWLAAAMAGLSWTALHATWSLQAQLPAACS